MGAVSEQAAAKIAAKAEAAANEPVYLTTQWKQQKQSKHHPAQFQIPFQIQMLTLNQSIQFTSLTEQR